MSTSSAPLGTSAECVRLDDRRLPRRPSPYFMSGAPLRCARCSAPFRQRDAHIACWHGADQRYYCSETCASGDTPRMDKSAA